MLAHKTSCPNALVVPNPLLRFPTLYSRTLGSNRNDPLLSNKSGARGCDGANLHPPWSGLIQQAWAMFPDRSPCLPSRSALSRSLPQASHSQGAAVALWLEPTAAFNERLSHFRGALSISHSDPPTKHLAIRPVLSRRVHPKPCLTASPLPFPCPTAPLG